MHSRSRIVRNQEWDPALAELNTLNLAELVLGLLSLDTVDGETALGVVDETEVLAGLLDGDHVHEAGGVGGVGGQKSFRLPGSASMAGEPFCQSINQGNPCPSKQKAKREFSL